MAKTQTIINLLEDGTLKALRTAKYFLRNADDSTLVAVIESPEFSNDIRNRYHDIMDEIRSGI